MKMQLIFNSKFFYFFIHLIVFFYIYSVQFTGLPFNIGTRVILAIFGFLLFAITILNKGLSLKINKQFLFIFCLLFCIIIISLISVVYNKTSDLEFLKYPFSIILILFAGYFVTKLLSYKSDASSVCVISKIIINVVIAQVILSLIMFLFQPLRDFLNSIQVNSDIEKDLLEATAEYRLVGFGSKFFGSGVLNGFVLILIASVLKFNSTDKTNVFRYSISFLIIFVLGMLMARTTIIGALFAFAILFYPKNVINLKSLFRVYKFFFYIIVVPVIFIFLLFYLLPGVKDSFELVFNFGFELFVNYFNSGKLESVSTNQLGEMFVWPSGLKTYFIGDGRYSDALTGGYYMNTDIGIFRLIYYFGLPGLVVYLALQFQVAYFSFLKNYNLRLTFIILFFYCVVLNFKGFADLVFLNALFLFNKSTGDKSMDN